MTREDEQWTRDLVSREGWSAWILCLVMVLLSFAVSSYYTSVNANRIDQLEKLLQDHLEQKASSAHKADV